MTYDELHGEFFHLIAISVTSSEAIGVGNFCKIDRKTDLPGTGEIKGVHEAEGSGTSHTARSQVTHEVPPELGVFVHTAQEHLLVLVLEGEVERLSWEITDHIGHITTPVGKDTLFAWDSHEAVHHTCKSTNPLN